MWCQWTLPPVEQQMIGAVDSSAVECGAPLLPLLVSVFSGPHKGEAWCSQHIVDASSPFSTVLVHRFSHISEELHVFQGTLWDYNFLDNLIHFIWIPFSTRSHSIVIVLWSDTQSLVVIRYWNDTRTVSYPLSWQYLAWQSLEWPFLWPGVWRNIQAEPQYITAHVSE